MILKFEQTTRILKVLLEIYTEEMITDPNSGDITFDQWVSEVLFDFELRDQIITRARLGGF